MKPSSSLAATLACIAFTVIYSGRTLADTAVDSRPNIILIMADDMGTDWVSAYGFAHDTPNIDRLACEGMQFWNAWCTPICTPTRIELLTGQYPFRTGWTDHHDVPRWGGIGFDWERFVCWARVLRDAGYATAIGGKWQVNDFRRHPDALSRHGFEEHCVWTGFETGNAPPSNERYWNPYMMTNGMRSLHEDEFGPTVINDFLIDFIKRHRRQPFLVYYPMLMPHGPYVATPLNKDDPPKSQNERYAGMITYVDELVGRIVKTVDELELTDKTVIIFTGDNGSSVAGELRGAHAWQKGKGRVTNVGAHVPLIVRAPSIIGERSGKQTGELIDFTDFYPTFVELAGAKLPDGMTLDGQSFVKVLDGTATPADTRKWIYSQRGDGRMVRNGRYLLDNQGGFYDLVADPLQKNNLAESTDPATVAARNHLNAILRGMPADAGSPFPEYRR